MAKPQDPPKSIRLPPDELARSQQIAGLLDIPWHRWITRLISWGNDLPPDKIKTIAETEDQERTQ